MSRWNQDTLYSSKHQAWETPGWLFDRLDALFDFDLDAAASTGNARCEHYIEEDSLEYAEWPGRSVWLNPPYGRGIDKWVKKAMEQAELGKRVVVLVFARTDTRWWHDYAMRAQDIYLIKGRLRFTKSGQEVGTAPAPSAVLVFNGKILPEASPRIHQLLQPVT
jgi:phage N-6-adenine-methyltransferase